MSTLIKALGVRILNDPAATDGDLVPFMIWCDGKRQLTLKLSQIDLCDDPDGYRADVEQIVKRWTNQGSPETETITHLHE
jgi:hypothetical protein